MSTVTTFDLAEAAFMLHQGLTLSSVEVRFNTTTERNHVYLMFRGPRAHDVVRAWNEATTDLVIPVDVARLLVALGEIGKVYV